MVVLDYERISDLREHHPVLRLIAAQNLPLICGFLHKAFIDAHRREIPHVELEALLDDYLHALRGFPEPQPGLVISIMDKQHFDQLVKGVREMKRHMPGKSVRGSRTKSVDEPDVRAIRRAADISQSQFAKLIGVNLRTLQNWEQAPDTAYGPGTRAVEDRGVQSEVGP